jgi:plasmid stability protein
VRTTLTLDKDVAAKLKTRARRTGRAFKDVVNEALRRGLEPPSAAPGPRFEVKARDLGRVRPGVNLNNVGDVLDQVEGPGHR